MRAPCRERLKRRLSNYLLLPRPHPTAPLSSLACLGRCTASSVIGWAAAAKLRACLCGRGNTLSLDLSGFLGRPEFFPADSSIPEAENKTRMPKESGEGGSREKQCRKAVWHPSLKQMLCIPVGWSCCVPWATFGCTRHRGRQCLSLLTASHLKYLPLLSASLPRTFCGVTGACLVEDKALCQDFTQALQSGWREV